MRQVYTAYPLKQYLVKFATLGSAMDQKVLAFQRRYGHKEFSEHWNHVGNYDQRLFSYSTAMQGDLLAPETVMTVTRNTPYDNDNRRNYYNENGGVNHDHWKYVQNGGHNRHWNHYWGYQSSLQGSGRDIDATFEAHFYGPGNQAHSMTGFATDEGNWGLAGGGTAQGSNSELNDQLKNAAKGRAEGDSIANGLNLTVLRPQQ